MVSFIGQRYTAIVLGILVSFCVPRMKRLRDNTIFVYVVGGEMLSGDHLMVLSPYNERSVFVNQSFEIC